MLQIKHDSTIKCLIDSRCSINVNNSCHFGNKEKGSSSLCLLYISIFTETECGFTAESKDLRSLGSGDLSCNGASGSCVRFEEGHWQTPRTRALKKKPGSHLSQKSPSGLDRKDIRGHLALWT